MMTRFKTHFGLVALLHLVVVLMWGVNAFNKSESSPKASSSVKISLTKNQAAVKTPVPVKPKTAVRPVPKKTISPEKKITETPPPVQEVMPSLAGSPDADLRSEYKAEVRAKIEANKFYPVMSRRMGQTGVVVVAFTLLEDGSIIDLHVHKSSRFERLDASALDAVRKVGRFSPIPKELGETQMDFTVPVKFFEI